MAEGHEFYALMGGTAATLLGLLFVSLSLNAEIILGPERRQLRRVAEQAFQNYLGVIVATLLVFFPGISHQTFGYTLIGNGVFSGAWVLTRAWQALQVPEPFRQRFETARRYLWSVGGFGFLIYAGHLSAFGDPHDAPGWTAGATIMLLVSATFVSWDLLVDVAGEKYAASRAEDKSRL